MIIMSNHNQDGERKLADEFRELSEINSKERITLITERFKHEVKIASLNGLTKIEFILIQKPNFIFINDNIINSFKEYLDNNGFLLYDYRYVDDQEIMEPFHYFVIGW